MTAASPSPPGRLRLTGTQWLICVIASIGFMFDTYELLMLPLVLRPALSELLNVAPPNPEYFRWAGILFFVPALCGGIFGLLGGWLTDRFGRRRMLTWSILLYAGSAFASGFATSIGMLLALRCLTFIGVCIEFVAGIAWLAELFPEPRRREAVLGYTQAFSSLGGLAVALASGLIIGIAPTLPEIASGHEPWRYTLMSGLLPAIPLILVRPWLPESPSWQAKRAAGTLKRPSFSALFSPALRRTTIVTTVVMASSYALAFGAIQQAPQIAYGLSDVRTLERPAQQGIASGVQKWQEVGGLTGRVLLAFLAIRILSRRRLLRVFQWPALVVLPLVFWLAPGWESDGLEWGLAACGLLVVAQFSFWGNYLPRVYPTHLRGTGESFAANVGGRIFGTAAALATTRLAPYLGTGSSTPTAGLAHAAALVALAVAVIGVAVAFKLPEPGGEELPE